MHVDDVDRYVDYSRRHAPRFFYSVFQYQDFRDDPCRRGSYYEKSVNLRSA